LIDISMTNVHLLSFSNGCSKWIRNQSFLRKNELNLSKNLFTIIPNELSNVFRMCKRLELQGNNLNKTMNVMYGLVKLQLNMDFLSLDVCQLKNEQILTLLRLLCEHETIILKTLGIGGNEQLSNESLILIDQLMYKKQMNIAYDTKTTTQSN